MDFAQALLDRLVIILMHDGRTVLVRGLRAARRLRRRPPPGRRLRDGARFGPLFLPTPASSIRCARLQGVLKGVDMQTTLVLSECRERIFSEDGGVEEVAVRAAAAAAAAAAPGAVRACRQPPRAHPRPLPRPPRRSWACTLYAATSCVCSAP